MKKQLCSLIALAAIASPALAQADKSNLADRSLEDLMNVEVTSVSKREQKLARTPAAIFVITQEDIRRSGATNIPDLLRMVPGMDVAQIDAHTWAISARGFTGEFSNKLLVMIDGRTVYTTTFSGVYWDQQDVPLEDIERIEVIRGQGASVWGANAVNGVINIITKSAEATQGGLLTAGGGTEQQGFGTMQFGGRFGSRASYRAFGKYSNTTALPAPDGRSGGDGWHLLHGGFRTDATLNDRDSLTVEGDYYGGSTGSVFLNLISLSPLITGPQPLLTDLGGGDVLARWHRNVSSRSDFTLQGYFDRYARDFPAFHESRENYDLEFQHHLRFAARHDFIWGLGYRVTSDQTRGSPALQLLPPGETDQLFSAFVQDEIALVADRLWLTAGVRFEHNDFTGLQTEPTVRLLWAPTDRQALWTSLSRATRSPSRADNGLSTLIAAFTNPSGQLVAVDLRGDPETGDEEATDLEVGYRTQWSHRASFDVNAFFAHYDALIAFLPGAPFLSNDPPPQHLVIPENATDAVAGWSRGLEVSSAWKVTHSWTLLPGYSFLDLSLHAARAVVPPATLATMGGSSPHHQAQLRSRWNLPHNLDLDLFAAFRDRLEAFRLPSRTRLDARLGWRPGEHVEIALVGQNLLQDHRIEFTNSNGGTAPSRIRRSGYLQFTWRY